MLTFYNNCYCFRNKEFADIYYPTVPRVYLYIFMLIITIRIYVYIPLLRNSESTINCCRFVLSDGTCAKLGKSRKRCELMGRSFTAPHEVYTVAQLLFGVTFMAEYCSRSVYRKVTQCGQKKYAVLLCVEKLGYLLCFERKSSSCIPGGKIESSSPESRRVARIQG